MTAGPLSSLLDAVPALSNARVACIGDVMLDRFVYGDAVRLSPEAPIPVCRVKDETAMLGGAGNVVRNLVALGARVEFVTVTGDDDVARDVDLLIENLEGVSATILRSAGRPGNRRPDRRPDGRPAGATPVTADATPPRLREIPHALEKRSSRSRPIIVTSSMDSLPFRGF